MPAVRTPHVDVDLDLMLAPGAFVGSRHGRLLPLRRGPLDCAERYLQRRRLRHVGAAGEFEVALPAEPYTGAVAAHGDRIAAGTAVGCPLNRLDLGNPLPDEPAIPWPETACTAGYTSLRLLIAGAHDEKPRICPKLLALAVNIV